MSCIIYVPSQFFTSLQSLAFLPPIWARCSMTSLIWNSLGRTRWLWLVWWWRWQERRNPFFHMRSLFPLWSAPLLSSSGTGCVIFQLISLTSIEMKASVPKVTRKGVSLVVEWGVFLYAHKTCEYSSSQFSLEASSLHITRLNKTCLVVSVCSFVWRCSTYHSYWIDAIPKNSTCLLSFHLAHDSSFHQHCPTLIIQCRIIHLYHSFTISFFK